MIHPALVADGRVVGRWRIERARGASTLVLEPFGVLSRPVLSALRDESEALAGFLGEESVLRVERP